MDGIKKLLGYRSFTLDDPEFDALFALSGYNEEKVRATWSPAARKRALDLAGGFARTDIELQNRVLMISTDVPLVEYQVRDVGLGVGRRLAAIASVRVKL